MTNDPAACTDDPAQPTGELNFSRIFKAPPALVFRCMIDPQHLTHFWGPTGTTTPIDGIVIDPRPGGVFETMMVNDRDGSRYRMRAVFDEVTEPERLVWTDVDSGMVTTIDFTDLSDDRTEVHIRQARVPGPIMAADAQAGFLTSLDRFTAYAKTLTEPASDPAIRRRTQ
ncbi:SRPBCC domain-containing protein [Kocuria aegyptia]|uniref:Activator of Hsp90 ATPase homologue 1/2-like C-terminal domain-containing protein n=1 Tax=Kocuria aegyptia TaxID=330943 RepID=A0ABN2KIN3_9MICC